jgi:hypothetical protein
MRVLLYRIGSMCSREALQGLGGESSAGEVAQRLRASPTPLEDALGAGFLRVELGDRVLHGYVFDAVAPEVVADERVARAPAGERPGAILGERVVGQKSGLGEAVECGRALVRCDAGALEALLDVMAGPVAVPERAECKLRRVPPL